MDERCLHHAPPLPHPLSAAAAAWSSSPCRTPSALWQTHFKESWCNFACLFLDTLEKVPERAVASSGLHFPQCNRVQGSAEAADQGAAAQHPQVLNTQALMSTILPSSSVPILSPDSPTYRHTDINRSINWYQLIGWYRLISTYQYINRWN